MMDFLKRNVKVKTVCILFAFFMWIFVMAEVDPILIKDYSQLPIKIKNENILQAKNLSILSREKLKVSVIIRGRRSVLKEFNTSNIEIYGSIKEAQIGENYVELKAKLPDNIDYTIIPSGIKVDIDKNIRVKKDIVLISQSKKYDAAYLAKLLMSPKFTYVEGPKTLISKLNRLACRIDLDSEEDSTVKAKIIPLDKNNEKIEGLKLRDEYCFINVGNSESRVVPIKISFKNNLAKNLNLKGYNLDMQNINIKGDEANLKDIKEIYTEPIDLATITSSGDVKLKLVLPHNISTNLKEVNANLEVSKLISKELLISKNRITFINNLQNLDISKNDLPENIKVNIVFSEDLEKKLKDDDLQVYINLQDKTSEIAKYEIKCNVPIPTEKVEIEPRYINIGN